MKNTEFEVIIPEGKELADGYVGMRHNCQYSILIKNYRSVLCDAEVLIDGIHVGTWRVASRGEIRVDRPVHDTGLFTFFGVDSREAREAGIAPSESNGLISITFKPEKEQMTLASSPCYGAGATGLTGESKQRFTNAVAIVPDESRFFTIHLRLVTHLTEIRPLAPRSTPIPPPVG